MNLVNKYLKDSYEDNLKKLEKSITKTQKVSKQEEKTRWDMIREYNDLLERLEEKNKWGHVNCLNKLKGADIKTQKVAIKLFKQSINLLKGLKEV